MPLTVPEKEAIIKADAPSSAYVTTVLADVWGSTVKVGTSRIDMVVEALRHKIQTKFGDKDISQTMKLLLPCSEVDEETFAKSICQKLNFNDYQDEVRGLFTRWDVDNTGKIFIDDLCSMLYNEPKSRAKTTLGKVREILAKRSGGISSLKTLGLQFTLLDSDGNHQLDREELEKGFSKFMTGFGMQFSKFEIDAIFKHFDSDKSGTISYDEFLHGVRGKMRPGRLELVRQAFRVLDKDDDGQVTLAELARVYDVSGHPLVQSGKLTEADVLKTFMAHWHISAKSHSDAITLDNFIEYYEWVSASIDRDDYFELMMRNAWHISGGKGWSENTTNRRVLVTHEDGRQTVETLRDDFDIAGKRDAEVVKERLRTQGIIAKEVAFDE